MTASHSASVMLTSMRSRRMPALLTSTSRPPKVSIALLDQPLGAVEVGDVVAVGDGLAAHGLDLVDDLLGRARRRRPSPSIVAAEVVDHDLGALGGELERVLAADAAARAGDDGHPAVADPHQCSPDRFAGLRRRQVAELLAQLVLVELAVVVRGADASTNSTCAGHL